MLLKRNSMFRMFHQKIKYINSIFKCRTVMEKFLYASHFVDTIISAYDSFDNTFFYEIVSNAWGKIDQYFVKTWNRLMCLINRSFGGLN